MNPADYKGWAICAHLHGSKPQIFGPYPSRAEAEANAKFYRRKIPQGVFNVFFIEKEKNGQT